MRKQYKNIVEPYLMQRCKVREGVPINGMLKTGDYLKLDYMGSAEFEFGAIPKFQRNVFAKLGKCVEYTMCYKDVRLYILCEPHQSEEYRLMLQDAIDNKIRMKEPMRLDAKEVLFVGKKRTAMYDQPHAPFEYDTWMDLDNAIFISRKSEILDILRNTVPNSIHYMDEQAKKER